MTIPLAVMVTALIGLIPSIAVLRSAYKYWHWTDQHMDRKHLGGLMIATCLLFLVGAVWWPLIF